MGPLAMNARPRLTQSQGIHRSRCSGSSNRSQASPSPTETAKTRLMSTKALCPTRKNRSLVPRQSAAHQPAAGDPRRAAS